MSESVNHMLINVTFVGDMYILRRPLVVAYRPLPERIGKNLNWK